MKITCKECGGGFDHHQFGCQNAPRDQVVADKIKFLERRVCELSEILLPGYFATQSASTDR